MVRKPSIKTIRKQGRSYYIWRWQDDQGNWREKSSGIKVGRGNRAKAEAAAEDYARQLSWPAFWARYRHEVLAARSKAYAGVMAAAVELALDMGVNSIHDLDASFFSRYSAALRKSHSAATASTYVKHLAALRRWAHRVGICAEKLVLPPGLSPSSTARRDPPTLDELHRALAACKRARPADYKRWRWILRALWASGLRLGESYALTWDDGSFCVLMQDPPMYRIEAGAQKSRRAQLLPVAPEFAKMLHARKKRTGRVFPYPVRQDQGSKVIRRIFRSAKLPYSAHDLRRAFATRWASVLMPADLQAIMRHGSVETTLKYYVRAQADDLAAKLYRAGGGF